MYSTSEEPEGNEGLPNPEVFAKGLFAELDQDGDGRLHVHSPTMASFILSHWVTPCLTQQWQYCWVSMFEPFLLLANNRKKVLTIFFNKRQNNYGGNNILASQVKKYNKKANKNRCVS